MSISKAIISRFTKQKGKKIDHRTWINLIVKTFSKIVVALILLGLSYVILYPIIFCLSQSVRTAQDMYDATIIYLPKNFTLDNFIKAWDFIEYPRVLVNTMNVSLWPTLLSLVSCALAGYGFARFKFPGKGILFGLVILTLIVPPQTIVITLYTSFRYFDPFFIFTGLNATTLMPEPYVDITGSLWSLILPSMFASGLRSGLFVFVYRQFFRGFPKELEEAAYIDGCGSMGTFIKILVPNALPAFTTVFLFSLVWYYNDYFTVPLFLEGGNVLSDVISNMYINMTSVGGTFHGMDDLIIFPIWRAGILLYVLPLLIMFLILQRRFTESIERSGIVG